MLGQFRNNTFVDQFGFGLLAGNTPQYISAYFNLGESFYVGQSSSAAPQLSSPSYTVDFPWEL